MLGSVLGAVYIALILRFALASASNTDEAQEDHTSTRFNLRKEAAPSSTNYYIPFSSRNSYNNGAIMKTTILNQKFSNAKAVNYTQWTTRSLRYRNYLMIMRELRNLTEKLCDAPRFRTVHQEASVNKCFVCRDTEPFPLKAETLENDLFKPMMAELFTNQTCVRIASQQRTPEEAASNDTRIAYLCRKGHRPYGRNMSKLLQDEAITDISNYTYINFREPEKNMINNTLGKVKIDQALCITDMADAKHICEDILSKQDYVIDDMPFSRASNIDDSFKISRDRRFAGLILGYLYKKHWDLASQARDDLIRRTENYIKDIVQEQAHIWRGLQDLKEVQWDMQSQLATVHHLLLVINLNTVFTQIQALATDAHNTFHTQLLNPHPYMYHQLISMRENPPKMPMHAQFRGFRTKVTPVSNGFAVEIFVPPFEKYVYANVSTYYTERDCYSIEDIYLVNPVTGDPLRFRKGTNITDIIKILHPQYEYPDVNHVALLNGRPVYLHPSCTYRQCFQDTDRAYMVPFEHLLMPHSFKCNYTKSVVLASDNGFSMTLPKIPSYNLHTCMTKDPLILEASVGMLSVNTGTHANDLCDNGQPLFLLPNSSNVFQHNANRRWKTDVKFRHLSYVDDSAAKIIAALLSFTFPKDTFVTQPPFHHMEINLTMIDTSAEAKQSFTLLSELPNVHSALSKTVKSVTDTVSSIFGWPGALLDGVKQIAYIAITLAGLYALVRIIGLVKECTRKSGAPSQQDVALTFRAETLSPPLPPRRPIYSPTLMERNEHACGTSVSTSSLTRRLQDLTYVKPDNQY